MAEIIRNLNINSVISLLKKPDIAIGFGNVSGENSCDIDTLEKLDTFLEENCDHDVELALIHHSFTDSILTLLTSQSYLDDLDESGDNAFVVVYNLGEQDLVIWIETSGFMVGSDFKQEHDELINFVEIPHFYPTQELLNDEHSSLGHYLNKYPAIIQVLKDLSITETEQ